MCTPCAYSRCPQPCCSPCHPCNIPYGQTSESGLGAELEAIPQTPPKVPPKPPVKKKPPKKKKITPLLMEPSKRVMLRLPKTRITKKVKADVLWSTWQCCKRNGLQDTSPHWFVLGYPYRRPGPSYTGRCCYYPANNQCRYC